MTDTQLLDWLERHHCWLEVDSQLKDPSKPETIEFLFFVKAGILHSKRGKVVNTQLVGRGLTLRDAILDAYSLWVGEVDSEGNRGRSTP